MLVLVVILTSLKHESVQTEGTASHVLRLCSTSLLSDKCHVLRTGFLSVGCVVTVVGRKPFQLGSCGVGDKTSGTGTVPGSRDTSEVQGAQFVCVPLEC